jgi:hypothetical protein
MLHEIGGAAAGSGPVDKVQQGWRQEHRGGEGIPPGKVEEGGDSSVRRGDVPR